jgi:hypothetical protein
MLEVLTTVVKCQHCGTTMETLPETQERTCTYCGISQPDPNKDRAATMASIRRFMGESPEIWTESTVAETTLLDQAIPPSLIEKSLPFLALLVVAAALFAINTLNPVAYSLMLLNPIFVAIHLYLKTERRDRARRTSYSRIAMHSAHL